MRVGSPAGSYWLNNEEIHIVGCPVYLGNYIKIIIRALNVFLILVYFFICSLVTSQPVTAFPRFTVIIAFCSPERRLEPSPPPPTAFSFPQRAPQKISERLETLYFYFLKCHWSLELKICCSLNVFLPLPRRLENTHTHSFWAPRPSEVTTTVGLEGH